MESMAMVGLKSGADAGTRGPATGPSRAGRLLRRISLSALLVFGAAMVLLALGFIRFIDRLPAEEVVLTRDADGIVVLTGGGARGSRAVELFAGRRRPPPPLNGRNPPTRP